MMSQNREHGRGGGILFVLAHPDDETFLCGGTIARYAATGTDVHLICVTRGEAGTTPPAAIRHRSIAAVRVDELTCAANVLGVKTLHFLDYRDSGMPGPPHAKHPRALVNTPIRDISNEIVMYIRALRPRVVVTHGRFGEYGHADHIRLHQATSVAFRDAGDPAQVAAAPSPWSPDALYAITLDPRRIRLLVRVLRLVRRDPRRVGRNADVDLVAIVDNAPPATCVIDVTRWLATRDRASWCHRSQPGGQRNLRFLPAPIRRRLGGPERYARLIPPPERAEPIHDDLIIASSGTGPW